MQRHGWTMGSLLLSVLCVWGPGMHGQARQAREFAAPQVWIFVGLTGDDERRQRYLATANQLRQALRDHFAVGNDDMVTLFGRGSPSPYPACTREALLEELDRLKQASGSGRPLWVFFIGHGASAKSQAVFHVHGRDVSARDLAERLRGVEPASHVVLFMTMSASGDFIPTVCGKQRLLVAASPPGARRNETECPHLLADVLASPAEADTDSDGALTVAEMVTAIRRGVARWYRERDLVCTESAVIDGNGDGHIDDTATGDDSRWARAIGLRYGKSDKTEE